MKKGTAADNRWYALYTRPRAEKKVDAELQSRGYESFLPLLTTLKQWSDRKKKVQIPLFNSYLFINTDIEKNYYDVLNIPGVVKFVKIGSQVATLRDEQIKAIKLFLLNEIDFEIGLGEVGVKTPVQIIAGPLKGLLGMIMEARNQNIFVVDLEQIGYNIQVALPAAYIKKI